MRNPKDVLDFWLKEVGPERWYNSSKTLDRQIRAEFEETWQAARNGRLPINWQEQPESMLALLILLDQFPRNMFRDEAMAFATDRLARAEAKKAIDKGWDLRIPEPERQFFYLPLMHSENLCDQERCVRLMLTRMPETGAENLLHAKAHREVIRRFGRFPHRNEALSRASTGPESTFVEEGGYRSTVEELTA